jgi:putative salt-induced outer membrane protein
VLAASAISLLLLVAPADTTQPARRPVKLRFTGDIGYVLTSGNSSVQTLNTGDKLIVEVDNLTLTQTFAMVYGESKGATVTSQYRGSLRMDVKLDSSAVSMYTLANLERNTFAGLNYRLSGSGGLAAEVVRTNRSRLMIEGGLSLTRQRATATKGKDSDFLGGRAATSYTYRFGPKASVSQAVEILPNFREPDDLRINTESSVVAPLSKAIGIKLSYVIRYDGLPPDNYYTTDQVFTSGLQFTL